MENAVGELAQIPEHQYIFEQCIILSFNFIRCPLPVDRFQDSEDLPSAFQIIEVRRFGEIWSALIPALNVGR